MPLNCARTNARNRSLESENMRRGVGMSFVPRLSCWPPKGFPDTPLLPASIPLVRLLANGETPWPGRIDSWWAVSVFPPPAHPKPPSRPRPRGDRAHFSPACARSPITLPRQCGSPGEIQPRHRMARLKDQGALAAPESSTGGFLVLVGRQLIFGELQGGPIPELPRKDPAMGPAFSEKFCLHPQGSGHLNVENQLGSGGTGSLRPPKYVTITITVLRLEWRIL
jgi:hypothetical protein